MEVLSKQQQPGQNGVLNLVNQSPDAVASSYNAVNTTGFKEKNLTFNPTDTFTEYRIDWFPDRIEFWADMVRLQTFYDYVPTAPGTLHLIRWSNGDPGWSAGPPTEDAVLTIHYVEAYFNTSQSVAACAEQLSTNNTCKLPSSGTFNVPTATATSMAGHPTHGSAATEARGGSLWAVVATAGVGGWMVLEGL